MSTNNTLNIILFPVIAGLATVSTALLSGGQILLGLACVAVTFAASYTYEVLIP